jgi:hypothetical protein
MRRFSFSIAAAFAMAAAPAAQAQITSQLAAYFEKSPDLLSHLVQCSTARRLFGKDEKERCPRALLVIRLFEHVAKVEKPRAIDAESSWVVFEELMQPHKPMRLELPVQREAISGMIDDFVWWQKRSPPDYDMIDCLSQLEFGRSVDIPACDYAYAKMQLQMSKAADVVDWYIKKPEFPYLLQQSLEKAYGTAE